MENDSPPLWKQALGAVVGAGIALGLYGIYTWAEPQVQALLLPPTETTETYTRINDKTLDEEKQKRLASRNQRVAARRQVSASSSSQASEPKPMEVAFPEVDLEQRAAERAEQRRAAPPREMYDHMFAEPPPPLEPPVSDWQPDWAPVQPEPMMQTYHPDDPWPALPGGQAVQAQVVPSGASRLPNSGVAHWLAAFGALVGALYVYRTRLTNLLSMR